jgi:TrmH family RNA methyltransferase
MTGLSRDELRDFLELRDRAARRDTGRLLVPGIKCCKDYLASGGKPDFILVEKGREAELLAALSQSTPLELEHVRACRPQDLARLGEQKSPEGVLIVGPKPGINTELPPQLLLDGLMDLGNLGSILRSALWFGLTRVWLVSPAADPWSPRGIRASMGAVFRLEACRTVDEDELGRELEKRKRRLLLLEPAGGAPIDEHVFEEQDLPVLGGESHGIRVSRRFGGEPLHIPGAGGMESLNAGHALAICAWEMHRQARRA